MAWVTTKDGRQVNTDWFDKDRQINENKKEADARNKSQMSDADRKKAQVEIIKKHNPKDYDINPGATWVESVDDIQTWDEAMNDEWSYKDSDVDPDFTWKDAQEAKKKGYVMVYSSKPIKQGTFVSPSRMIAVSYGNDHPYSKKVKLEDVAWIDLSEGQFAEIK
jgi:hypothetical protein